MSRACCAIWSCPSARSACVVVTSASPLPSPTTREVWSAAQGRWLEVSSVSNFETYQSNRLHCRFRNAEGKPELVHTLNGSALALPRIVAALLENHQTPDGIRIPAALQRYTGFDRIA